MSLNKRSKNDYKYEKVGQEDIDDDPEKYVYFEDTRWFAWAAMLICFWGVPFGILAIKNANNAKYHHVKGHYKTYQSSRTRSQVYVFITVLCGVIVNMTLFSVWLSVAWKGFEAPDLAGN
eukprot:623216_1